MSANWHFARPRLCSKRRCGTAVLSAQCIAMVSLQCFCGCGIDETRRDVHSAVPYRAYSSEDVTLLVVIMSLAHKCMIAVSML